MEATTSKTTFFGFPSSDRGLGTALSIVLLVVLSLAQFGCGGSGGQSSSLLVFKKVDITTTTIGTALKSMLMEEERYATPGWEPKQATLETYWMSFTSTTLDMKRLIRVLDENPGILPKARDMWIGRVQDNLAKMKAAGMLTDMDGPISSKLGPAFGEERVAKEGTKLLQAADAIEEILGIQEPVDR